MITVLFCRLSLNFPRSLAWIRAVVIKYSQYRSKFGRTVKYLAIMLSAISLQWWPLMAHVIQQCHHSVARLSSMILIVIYHHSPPTLVNCWTQPYPFRTTSLLRRPFSSTCYQLAIFFYSVSILILTKRDCHATSTARRQNCDRESRCWLGDATSLDVVN